ncbi:hypothetical protein IOD16_13890 [Saccharothrix sp. 6-C]|uniref:hypothetical protein n=1 Tax=Saccharothrix sp. 6-C TaxID=2781735 RepID=UPI0019177A3B|nr:hypothetical protein [Saccharothrix sp. 6-C]QQQ79398.1 hypothetical protein IOD16_13890 [Saccharothrix sp. 6-C]
MPGLRRLLRSTAIGLLLAPLLVVTGHSASAYTGTGRVTVYQTVAYCVQGAATIDHFSGGFSGNIGYANAYLANRGITGACTLTATGNGRTRLDVQVWNGSAWAFCRGSDWKYGPFGWTSGEFGGPYGPQQLLDYGGSVCGPGYYRTVASAEYDTGSGWVGGTVASGHEWVP